MVSEKTTVEKETREVREAHRFDATALQRFLQERLDDDASQLDLRQFNGGQSNPTYLVTTGKQRYVLRKKPPGTLLPSAHAIEREYRVMSALRESKVPVPHLFALCEDTSVIGTPFFLMEWIDGRVVRNPLMPSVANPADRNAICKAMIDTLGKLHTVDFAALGLQDFGRPGNYMARQVARWSKQYQASKTDEVPSMNQLIDYLPRHVPEHEATSIVHGDFRLENMIVHPTETRILAVLDWELSTLGHPLADLGYACMLYHLPRGEMAGSGYLGAKLDELGIPTQEAFIAAYCQAAGRETVEDIDYFIAFGLFRLAAIVQGVYKRGLDGNASSETALQFGPMVKQLADIAWQLLAHQR